MTTINAYMSRPLLSGRESQNSASARPNCAHLAPRGSSPMSQKYAIAAALLLALPLLVVAQDDDTGKPQVWGAYTVQQTVEFGGRVASVNGNQATYDTFTDEHSGPRLLGQNLTMTTAPGSGLTASGA